MGHQDSDLRRRYASTVRIQGGGNATVLIFLLEALGVIVNKEKSVLCPFQEIEFLGLVDSQSLQLKLPTEKMKQIRKEAAAKGSPVSPSTFPVY